MDNELPADGGAGTEDTLTLCRIVREREAELADIRAKRQSVVNGLTRAITAEGEANKAYYAACAERDALRERIANMKIVFDDVLRHSIEQRERLAKLEAFVWQLSEHGCAEFDGQLQRARDFLVDQEIDLTPVLRFPK